MFSRNRSSRSSHGTAYTGVSQNTNNTNKPNSGALAAALTIGNAMKQQKGNQSVSRSPSFQYQQPNTSQQRVSSLNSSNGSLLKRGSKSNIQLQPPPTHTASQRRFSNGSFSSQGSNRGNSSQAAAYYNSHHPEVYDIDDSFNDSYLDEITEESTQVYLNNKAKMQDLRLPTANLKSQGQPKVAPPVRMVKKYVPSPTGIKIIEVPESTFQKEVARSNSMRLNPISSRSGSLRNIANKKPPSRASSLNTRLQQRPAQQVRNVSTPSKMQSMSEDVNLEESLGKVDTNQAHEAKLRALEKEIEHEKQLAKELEEKRLEYERLREQNLANERKQKEFEKSSTEKNTIENKKEFSSSLDDEYVPIIEKTKAVDELDKKNLAAEEKDEEILMVDQHEEQASANLPTEKSVTNTQSHEDELTDSSENEVVSVGEIVASSSISDHSSSVDGSDIDDNIRVAVVVDNAENAPPGSELEKLSDIEVVSDKDDEVDPTNKSRNWATEEADRLDATEEMNVIAQYEDSKEPPLIVEPRLADDDRNAATINSKVESADTLLPPAVATALSSKSSVYSNDSTKKPIKSAMKSSSSFAQLPQKQGPAAPPQPSHATINSNAAKQAYLSLTTAENTRLNSQHGGGAYPLFSTTPQFQKAPAKRLSQQTLRRQQHPQQQPPPSSQFRMSMRPQSMVGPMQQQHQPQRQQLKGVSVSDLYAKAQSRPFSQFQPLKRQSSFSKEPNDDVPARSPNREQHVPQQQQQQPQQQQQQQRHHLQPQSKPLQHQPQSQPQPLQGRTTLRDLPGPSKNGFKSRFNDSDDDDDMPAAALPAAVLDSSPVAAPSPAAQSSPQKKKLGGKLKKLFKRN